MSIAVRRRGRLASLRPPTIKSSPGSRWVGALVGLCLVVGIVAGVSPKYAVFLMLGLAFVIVVFSDLVMGLAIYAGISFLEVLSVGGAGTSFSKIAGLLLFASWVASRATARRDSTSGLLARHPAMVAWMVAFVAWSTISVVWTLKQAATLETAYRDALELLVVPIIYSAVRNRRDLFRIIVGYMVGAGISVVYGLVIPPPTTAVAQGDVGRLVGGLGEANSQATVLVAGLALAAGMALVARRSPRIKAVLIVASALSVLGLVTTLSRAGLVATGVVLVASTIVGGRWRWRAAKVSAVCAVAVVGYFLLFAPAQALKRVTSSTTSGRNDVWLVGWRMFVDNPVIGVGAGNFAYVAPSYLQRPGLIVYASDFLVAPKVAHNIYLEQLAELGVPGLIMLLGVIAAGLYIPLRAARIYERLGDDEMELLARGVTLALIAFLAADFFASGLLSKQLWLVFAAGPVLLKLAEGERRRTIAA